MVRITLLLLSLIIMGHGAGSAAPKRIYHVAQHLSVTDTTIVFPPIGSEPYAAIETRVAVNEPRRLRTGKSPAWFEIGCGEMRLVVQRHTQVADNIHDNSTILLSLFSADSLLFSGSARDMDLNGGENSYLLEWNATSDTLNVYAGHDKIRLCGRVKIPAPSGIAPVTFASTGTSTVSLLVAEEKEIPRERRLQGMSADSITAVIDRHHHEFPAGVYRYLDRSTDPDIARHGGRYSLAILPDPQAKGRYVIYYLSGAEVDSDFWKAGMIKGYLSVTPFRNQYDLEWFDAHGNPIPSGNDSYAVTDSNAATLTLTFPSLGSATLRFSRIATP